MLQEMTISEMQDINGGVFPLVIPAAAYVVVAAGAAAGAVLAGAAVVITAVKGNTNISTCPAPKTTPKKP